MSITLDPTLPPDSGEPARIGASRIRTVVANLLALLGQPTTTSQTLALAPFPSVDQTTGLATVQGNPTVSAGIANKAYVDGLVPAYASVSNGGAGSAYTGTSTPAITTYVTGQVFALNFQQQNPGTPVTVNLNALGVKTLKKAKGIDLAAGDLAAGAVIIAVFDGTNFQVQAPTVPITAVTSASLAAAVFIGTTPTTILAVTATAPSTGGPYLAFVRYQFALGNTIAGTDVPSFWVDDGSGAFDLLAATVAIANVSLSTGISQGGFMSATYANGASTTFTVKAQAVGTGTQVTKFFPGPGTLGTQAGSVFVRFVPVNG